MPIGSSSYSSGTTGGTYSSGAVTTNYYSSGTTGYTSGYSSGMTLKYAAGHTHPDGVAVATDHWHGTAGYSHGHGGAVGYGAGYGAGWSKLVEWQLPYERGLRWDDGRAWRDGGQWTPGHPRKNLPMAELYPWGPISNTQAAPAVEQPMCRGRGNWR